jgi:hypothetical protein
VVAVRSQGPASPVVTPTASPLHFCRCVDNQFHWANSATEAVCQHLIEEGASVELLRDAIQTTTVSFLNLQPPFFSSPFISPPLSFLSLTYVSWVLQCQSLDSSFDAPGFRDQCYDNGGPWYSCWD